MVAVYGLNNCTHFCHRPLYSCQSRHMYPQSYECGIFVYFRYNLLDKSILSLVHDSVCEGGGASACNCLVVVGDGELGSVAI